MDIKGNRIIAVDFDGTLHTGTWPEIGEVNTTVFNFCRNEQLNGSRLILWTNRTGKQGRNMRALSERIRGRQAQLERSQHRNDSSSQEMDHAEEYQ